MGTEDSDEKLSDAVHALATGRGAIKERLVDALVNHIAHIDERDLPEPALSYFQSLMQRVTRSGPKVAGEGKIQATVREMSEDEAVNVAEDVMGLADLVELILDLERHST